MENDLKKGIHELKRIERNLVRNPRTPVKGMKGVSTGDSHSYKSKALKKMKEGGQWKGNLDKPEKDK